jgi:PAS domain S-box-containing protein
MFRNTSLSGAFIARLFERSPNPYVILDRDLTIIGMNEAYLRVTMRSRESIVGRNMFEAFPSEPGSTSERLLRTSLERALETGEPDHLPLIPYPIAMPDGTLEMRYWSATHTPLTGDDGRTTDYVLQHTVDVTELHELRQRAAQGSQGSQGSLPVETDILRRADAVANQNLILAEEHSYLRELFEQAPSFMAVLRGPDHVFDLANAAYVALIGGRKVLGLPVVKALPEVVEQGFLDLLDRVYQTGEPFVARAAPIELARGEDGRLEQRYLDFLYQPIRDSSGVIRGIFVQGHDVTEQKQAELAAQESERRFRSLAQSIPNHVWTTDINGNLIWCNDRIYDYTGHRPEDALGRPIGSTVHPDDQDKTMPDWDAARREGRPFQSEVRLLRRDGVYRWHLVRAVPVFDSSGVVERWIGTNTDIEDNKRTETQLEYLAATLESRIEERTRELEAAQATLRQSQKMEAVGNLAGGIAHDFNNLLQVITGSLQLLSRQPLNEKGERYIENAMAATERGAELASQLLSFGRRQPLEPKVLNLGRVVRGMDPLIRRSIGEGIEVDTIVSGGLWNTIADPTNVETALLNLAINARDAMEGHGRLTIELGNAVLDDTYARTASDVRPGQYVMLAVTDTGSGIAPEILERVFEPFFTTKAEGRGTGLGLSMVYGFAKQSGGHVAIYSEPGRGTTVRIYLPRSLEEESRIESRSTEVVGGSELVLVVEDDESVRETAVHMLRELGYSVLTARDPDGAWAVVQSGLHVDLIFTDVVMPGKMKSTELAHRAKELNPRIGVLFTSGYTENSIVHDGKLDAGIQFLGKPYSREQLAWKLRQILDHGRSGASTEAKKPRVLICEDEPMLRLNLKEVLEDEGFDVTATGTLSEALAQDWQGIDALVTDMNLPDGTGISVMSGARAMKPGLPAIVASGALVKDPLLLTPQTRLLLKPFAHDELVETLRKLLEPSL